MCCLVVAIAVKTKFFERVGKANPDYANLKGTKLPLVTSHNRPLSDRQEENPYGSCLILSSLRGVSLRTALFANNTPEGHGQVVYRPPFKLAPYLPYLLFTRHLLCIYPADFALKQRAECHLTQTLLSTHNPIASSIAFAATATSTLFATSRGHLPAFFNCSNNAGPSPFLAAFSAPATAPNA